MGWYSVMPVEQHSTDVSNLGWFIACIPVAFWLAQKRGAFREKFSGQPTMGMDFCCYWCCQPCTVAQDGKALDESQSVHVECCCNKVAKGGAFAQPTMVVVGQV